MHVGILTFQFPSRTETFVREHVEGLLRRGHRVTVLCRGVGGGIRQEELEELLCLGLKIKNHPVFGRNRRWNFVRMLGRALCQPAHARWLKRRAPWSRAEMFEALFRAEVLRVIKADVVHIHFGTLAAPLHRVLLDEQPPARFVVTWHGYDANQQTESRGHDMYREIFRGPHRHTVGSDFMRKRLLHLGAEPEKMEVIPMGVDLARFKYSPRILQTGDTLRLVSVGRLDEVKGHTHLIAAVSRLIREGERIQLRIVGEGTLRSRLETEIRKTGLPDDAIRLVGAKTSREVVSEMEQAQVFALTGVVAANGSVESQGVVYAEAQASGLPVIGSRIGGVSESLLDARSGILCAPGDESAIADALRFFLNNPERIVEFGRLGRCFVEERYGRDRMLDAFERVYAKM